MTTWEALTDEAISILADSDRNRWRLGAIGCEVETAYGEKSIQTFCKTVKVKPKTLYEYIKVTRFYPQNVYEEYPLVRYTQWRDAMRLKDVEIAMQLIERANDDNMTMRDFYEQLKALLPLSEILRRQKIFDGVVTISYHDETISFQAPVLLTSGAQYHITIREA